jgi:hypothetical protein
LATVVHVAQSTVTGNSTGWQATNGAQVQSYGNNNVGGDTGRRNRNDYNRPRIAAVGRQGFEKPRRLPAQVLCSIG